MGIFIAIPIVATSRADVLSAGLELPGVEWIGLGVLALVACMLFRTSTKADAQA